MNAQLKKPSGVALPLQAAGQLARVVLRAQRLPLAMLRRRISGEQAPSVTDLRTMLGSYAHLAKGLLRRPGVMLEAQRELLGGLAHLGGYGLARVRGDNATAIREPARGDRRFTDPAWQEALPFDLLHQAYLLVADVLNECAARVDGSDPQTAHKIRFYTRQLTDALAPSNYLLTNPLALKTALDTRGLSLLRGLANLLGDLERGGGRLRISMTDFDRFELGVNVATTSGQVVFQNELMQLIQYAPRTAQVYRRPLLIVPPWINKFYILDLRAENSFIRWAVDQGHTVFVVSWVNPDRRLADKDFQDYMSSGLLAALDAIEQATGEREVQAIGYCLGGTLLAATLAYMHARGDRRIRSATYFVTLVDFSEPGDIGVFIDEDQLARIDEIMDTQGYLDGASMAMSFNMLRANDLIWNYVVSNYLLGNDPPAFDLLYWNADSTRMPRAMHSFYLHNMYEHNRLREPGGIRLYDVPIDLGKIDVPGYVVATREDHIAPWRACYRGASLYAGRTQFVLGESGHIAGVINPPDANKYGYWTSTKSALPDDADAWLAGARRTPGSWWLHWRRWAARYGGKKVPARRPGNGGLPQLEPAPGSYVREKS